MVKTKIAGAVAAVALLAAPSIASAHDGHHHRHGHHHKHHAQVRQVAAGTPTATVTSFTGGVLTLTTTSGKAFAATESDKTTILCFTAAPQTTATASRHRDDGPNHDGSHDNSRGDLKGNGKCDDTALVAGAKVAYAKLSLRDGDATWKKVVILK